ncbi:MAG: protein kinase [Cyanobacteria bacterium J06627_28]
MLINNRYEVIRSLGEGGFGHAYLAEDTQMPSRRKCVIKQLKPITTSPEVYQVVQERFQREAAILEQLGENHPQIPRLHAYFTENQQFYLVQEWIDGEPLETVAIPQSESAVLALLTSILPVLKYIHLQGIIHRDIKPDNIILRSNTRQPVLIDFGAVRETMGTVMAGQSRPVSSIVIGTPGYMSSEQAVGRPIPSSDLYSLGLTAIYLLTGEAPQMLPSDTQTGEILWQHAAPDVSPKLAAVLSKAVKSHPRDRYPVAQAMIDALAAPDAAVSTNAPTEISPDAVPPSVAPNTVPPNTVPPSAPLPTAAPSTSQLQTMAVSPVAASTYQQPPQTAQQPTQVNAGYVPSGVSPASPQPWFKTFTPLTVGLLVLLVGGSAIGGGLMVSRANRDTSVQPLVSSTEDRETEETTEDDASESSLDASVTIQSGNREVEISSGTTSSGSTDSSSSTPPVTPPVDPVAPPPPVEPTGRRVTLSDSGREQIDVYARPTFNSESPHYGVSGDRVLATNTQVDSNGLPWVFIRFDSGAEGWVPQYVTDGSRPPVTTLPVEPPPSLENVPKYTTLAGSAGDRINVRSAPSTSASSPHYGVPGDPVQILDAAAGSDGYAWYFVAFESGAEGWVRADLLQL